MDAHPLCLTGSSGAYDSRGLLLPRGHSPVLPWFYLRGIDRPDRLSESLLLGQFVQWAAHFFACAPRVVGGCLAETFAPARRVAGLCAQPAALPDRRCLCVCGTGQA